MNPVAQSWLHTLWRPELMSPQARSLFRELMTDPGHASLLAIVLSVLVAWSLSRWVAIRRLRSDRHLRLAQWVRRIAWPVLAVCLLGILRGLAYCGRRVWHRRGRGGRGAGDAVGRGPRP